MKLRNFPHLKYSMVVNKKQIPIVEIPYSDYSIWNELYQYCRKKFTEVEPTKSLALPNGIYKGHYRYMVTHINQSHELVFVCHEGCFRFIIQPSKLKENTVSGRKSVLELYKIMDKYSIDFSKYACENGLKVKETIQSPIIELCNNAFLDKVIDHVYHLDLNSGYASRIVEAYPELKEVYTELYENRKEDNNFFKHVLTNSIGCMQSAYCPDYKERRKSKPYQFANLSKIAINGTREIVLELKSKLREKGKIPILINTDGIWYYSKNGPYHDENEGTGLGQWKNDHLDCKILIASKGSYQYLENGVCHTVFRGTSNLDKVKSRDDWEFGDIEKLNGRAYYVFDKEKGIVEDYA